MRTEGFAFRSEHAQWKKQAGGMLALCVATAIKKQETKLVISLLVQTPYHSSIDSLGLIRFLH